TTAATTSKTTMRAMIFFTDDVQLPLPAALMRGFPQGCSSSSLRRLDPRQPTPTNTCVASR
ncbi:MAG: hypothetical protein AAGI46_15445, partial [Planctomycetota bacterium]